MDSEGEGGHALRVELWDVDGLGLWLVCECGWEEAVGVTVGLGELVGMAADHNPGMRLVERG